MPPIVIRVPAAAANAETVDIAPNNNPAHPGIIRIIGTLEVVLRQAKQERWGIWKQDTSLSVPALQRVCACVCEALQVPIPTVVHDTAVGTAMGIYQPLDCKILLGTRTSGTGVSVTTLIHELAHHLCYKLSIPSTEENARAISITALFDVWPDKRGRPDIMYQESYIQR